MVRTSGERARPGEEEEAGDAKQQLAGAARSSRGRRRRPGVRPSSAPPRQLSELVSELRKAGHDVSGILDSTDPHAAARSALAVT